jgi:photosystem II stability/assembly factor-like uncharacterized protein
MEKKMKTAITITLFLMLLSFNVTFSQSGWVRMNPQPAGYLYSVDVIDQNTAFAVGPDGAIIKTTNGGINWVSKPSGTYDYLISVSFINSTTGWVAGFTEYNGIIIKTTDGGENWAVRSDGINAPIYSIIFINSQIGFAAGDKLIFKSVDGGLTWSPRFYNDSLWFNSILFVDQNTGWAVGGEGAIYKTTNCGEYWIRQQCNSVAELISVFFINQNTGWASGGSFWNSYIPLKKKLKTERFNEKILSSSCLLKTTDGGNYWFQLGSPGISYLSSVYFLNENSGLVLEAYTGTVYKTNNLGGWDQVLQANTYLVSQGFYSNTGWVVGLGKIYKTSNFGSNWTTQLNVNTDYLTSTFFTSSETGWAAGNPDIIKTTNGGLNWDIQYRNDSLNIYSLYFIDQNTGWTGGYVYDNYNYYNIGKIYKTTNGGYNWQNVYSESEYIIQNIFFPSRDTGYAVGEDDYSSTGVIIKTVNGGSTWLTLSGGYNWYYQSLYSIFFVSNDTGWVGSNQGNIFKTTNGGISWNEQHLNSYFYVHSIFFTDSQTGWAVGYNNNYGYGSNIYHTTNGGLFWSQQTCDTNVNIMSVYFISQTTGWAAGMYGTLIKTSNGGYNWYRQQSGTGMDLNSIFFVSPTIGYTVGSLGTILKTTTGGEPIGIKPISREILNKFYLSQNFPNPFNPRTVINYELPVAELIRLTIYDILGREVEAVVNEIQRAGKYQVSWDAGKYASGIYFYKLSAGDYKMTKKMVLIK